MTPWPLLEGISLSSATRSAAIFETLEHLPEGKAVLTGSPIRQELSGDKYKGKGIPGIYH